MSFTFNVHREELPCLTPEEIREIGIELAQERAENEREQGSVAAKTASEWAAVKGCGKDTALKWLKAGEKYGAVERSTEVRKRIDGWNMPTPVYRVTETYASSSATDRAKY